MPQLPYQIQLVVFPLQIGYHVKPLLVRFVYALSGLASPAVSSSLHTYTYIVVFNLEYVPLYASFVSHY